MKIIYMGTPEFAVLPLRRLIQDGFEICAAVTQPDRPKGRGMKLAPPPVKEYAAANQIPVYQPETLKNNELLHILEKHIPDLIVVVAYGKILPKYILDFPRLGCVNLHASLLPKYRGAAPIHHAVINGDSITGVSTMFMAEGMDTGDVINSAECEISDSDTTESMFERLSVLGAELLSETAAAIEKGELTRTPQDESRATYAPMIKKENCRINWNKSAKEIVNLIRGCYSAPIAYTYTGDIRIRVYKAVPGGESKAEAGKIINIDDAGMEVACGDGNSLLIEELQFAGSRRMTPIEYIRGNRNITGENLD